jgi:hypothetical protein
MIVAVLLLSLLYIQEPDHCFNRNAQWSRHFESLLQDQSRGSQIPDAKPQWRLNFVRWRLLLWILSVGLASWHPSSA